MEFQTLINDVKGKAQTYAGQAQNAAQTSVDTVKKANDVVVKHFKTLAETETTAAKDLYAEAVKSFEKARKDGVKTVAAAPVGYLPKDRAVTAFDDTVKIVVKTRDELTKVFNAGFEGVQIDLGIKKAPVKKAVKRTTKRATTARKTATKKATTTAKKATTAAKKATA